jgi:SRSO17 transposase
MSINGMDVPIHHVHRHAVGSGYASITAQPGPMVWGLQGASGQHSAGVVRQYSGTAGCIENCQIRVFVAYASQHGQGLLDRGLYVPKEWIDEPPRCQQARIQADRWFVNKPQLARQKLARALDAGVPARWVTGDSVDGDDRRLRMWLESRPQAYVRAVSGKEYV